jgi:hypothetical protein
MRSAAILASLGLAILGCARSGAAPSPTPRARSDSSAAPEPRRESRPRQSSDVITQQEIAAYPSMTAYEVVTELRPRFLWGRGVRGMSVELPVVYVDNMAAGGPDALRRIPSTSVQEIRFIDAKDATTRFGTGHTAGAILVKTKS